MEECEGNGVAFGVPATWAPSNRVQFLPNFDPPEHGRRPPAAGGSGGGSGAVQVGPRRLGRQLDPEDPGRGELPTLHQRHEPCFL